MARFLFTLLYLFHIVWAFAQNQKIVAGPMNGYSEHRECLIWVQTKCAKKISLNYTCESDEKMKGELVLNLKSGDNCEPAISKFIITNLQPGKTYKYVISLDDKEVKFDYPLKFYTRELWEWRTEPPAFSVLLGSCNYINDSLYDRPGEPYGQSTKIFRSMAESPAKTMIWLGDNVYLREADYSSESGIRYRYMHTRKHKDLQKLLATKHHYAILDDHDYGPNNSCKTYDLKYASTEAFKDYWGNKYYGIDGKGTYSRMQKSDCDFFMLDNRSFRDEDELNDSLDKKTQLGKQQLDWLLQSLLSSKASFKFIVMGGQFLNMNTDQESYQLYKNERKYILDFIIKYKIFGVVFISGDRHHTEILRHDIITADTLKGIPVIMEEIRKKDKKKEKKNKADQTQKENDDEEEETPAKSNHPVLYEITCSPLTSKGSNVLKTAEATNPQRVKHTLVVDPNFCQLSVSGRQGNRNLLIKCFDASNELRWEFTIRQEELKW